MAENKHPAGGGSKASGPMFERHDEHDEHGTYSGSTLQGRSAGLQAVGRREEPVKAVRRTVTIEADLYDKLQALRAEALRTGGEMSFTAAVNLVLRSGFESRAG